jgi:hypothetical protein
MNMALRCFLFLVLVPFFAVAQDTVLKPIEQNGKWGYAGQDGRLIISAQYDEARIFSDGLAAVKMQGKWGFIDKTGQLVIPLSYDSATSFIEGRAWVNLNGEYGYIDKTGRSIKGNVGVAKAAQGQTEGSNQAPSIPASGAKGSTLPTEKGAQSSWDAASPIIKATYGANGKVMDVTTHVQSRVAGNQLSIPATNEEFGNDPIYGVVKTLTVRYRTAEGEKEASASEGETLRLSFEPPKTTDQATGQTTAQISSVASNLVASQPAGLVPPVDQPEPSEPYHSQSTSLTVGEITNQDRLALNLGAVNGVIVRASNVKSILTNDVITTIDSHPVANVEVFRELTEDLPVANVTITLLRIPSSGLAVPKPNTVSLPLRHPFVIKRAYSSHDFTKNYIIYSMVCDFSNGAPRIFFSFFGKRNDPDLHFAVLDLERFSVTELCKVHQPNGNKANYRCPIVVSPTRTMLILYSVPSGQSITVIDLGKGTRTIQMPFKVKYEKGIQIYGFEYIGVLPEDGSSRTLVELNSGRIVARYNSERELQDLLPSMPSPSSAQTIGVLGEGKDIYVGGFLGGWFTQNLVWPESAVPNFEAKYYSDNNLYRSFTVTVDHFPVAKLEAQAEEFNGQQRLALTIGEEQKETLNNGGKDWRDWNFLKQENVAATAYQYMDRTYVAFGLVGISGNVSVLEILELASTEKETETCRQFFVDIERHPNRPGTLGLCAKYLRECPNGRFVKNVQAIQARLQKELKTPEYDDSLFAEAKKSGFAKDYRQYLELFPKGRHSSDAHVALTRLDRMDAVLKRLAELLSQARYGAGVNYEGYRQDGIAFINIHYGVQGLGALMDIVTGDLENMTKRGEAIGNFQDEVRATFLSVPGVKEVRNGGQTMTGGTGKAMHKLVELAQGSKGGSAAPGDNHPTSKSQSGSVNNNSATEKASAGTSSKASAQNRWVYGTVKFKSGSPASKFCDLVIWTKGDGLLDDGRSYPVCTNSNGEFKVFVDESYVVEIHFKGHKYWSGSVKTYQGARVDVVVE